MHSDNDAKILLGLPPDSRPSPSQVKAAYRSKVWETHPDRYPAHEKAQAESKFKLISEAYTFLSSADAFSLYTSCCKGTPTNCTASCSWVMKNGVARPHGGRRNMRVASVPFFLIILGALTLGGSTASRAYTRQKEAHPCFNPFLP